MRITLSSCSAPRPLAQPRVACIINLAEGKHGVRTVRTDPEVQAGRALRRLRLSRGWSQERVAIHMRDFGYDFHQTTIAKIEGAQRPLRVRELADFAALYTVEVQELIYPLSGSLAEIDRDIAEVQVRLEVTRRDAKAAAEQLTQARAALDHAQAAYATCSRQDAMLEERLSFLQKEREKFALWESDETDKATEKLTFSDESTYDLKPDALTATNPAEFVEALQQYRAWSGDPSWRRISERAGHAFVYSTLYAAMNSDSLPKLEIVKAIIIGCGGGEDDLENFATAWRRIRSEKYHKSVTSA
jgi:transcriptional regulator with XRE-family HTH domain